MNRVHRLIPVVGLLCVVSLVACSAARKADHAGTVQSGTIEARTVEAVAKVTKVDKKNRTVTVERLDGQTVTLDVGPEVKNFDQIDPGDEVRMVYYESVAFDVKVPGKATPGVQVAQGADTAQEGKKPGIMGARMVTVTATIEKISHDPDAVTLRGPEGGLRTIKVRDPENLENVEVGDLVELTYTQAMAVTVEETKPAN